MYGTVLISIFVSCFTVGVLLADAVCYHPDQGGLDPLAPMQVQVAWK